MPNMNQWDGSRTLRKSCAACGKDFSTFASQNTECCSVKCAGLLKSEYARLKNERTCEVCGETFVPKHTKSPGYTCSKKCNGVRSRLAVVKCGEYLRVFAPEHPNASKQGYVLEHRVVAEQKIGRRLKRGEVVHHIDGNRSNNTTENLEVLTDSQHKLLHSKERQRATKGTFAK